MKPAEVIGSPVPPGTDVTVVMSTYNQIDLAAESVRGVLQQIDERLSFHLLVNDDASTDGTAELLREFVAEHGDRMEVTLQAENTMSQGYTWGEQYLADLSTPFVAFCEGDDVWIDPEKLERQLGFMEANPWCSISHHAVEISEEGDVGDYARELHDYLEAHQPRGLRTPGSSLVRGNFMMTCSVMVRTSERDRAALLGMHGIQPEDYVIFSLAADRGDIGYLPDVMSRYRLHGANYWSSLPPSERVRLERDALWFLGAHLHGDMREAMRARVLEIEFDASDEQALAPVLRIRGTAD